MRLWLCVLSGCVPLCGFVCVIVCVNQLLRQRIMLMSRVHLQCEKPSHTHTHVHTLACYRAAVCFSMRDEGGLLMPPRHSRDLNLRRAPCQAVQTLRLPGPAATLKMSWGKQWSSRMPTSHAGANFTDSSEQELDSEHTRAAICTSR